MLGHVEGRLCKVVIVQPDGRMKIPGDAARFLGIEGKRVKAAVYLVERGGSRELRITILEPIG